MPNPSRNNRYAQEEKSRTEKLSAKSASFHGRIPASQAQLRRPKTDPDLLSGRKFSGVSPEVPPRLTKLLLNVTLQGSLGAVHVIMSPESTVGDLIAAAVRQYTKDGRRPLLQTADPSCFDLHYSSFSLESLDRESKLMTLGSRNFFLCPKKIVSAAAAATATTARASSSSCSNQAEKAGKASVPWLKFMELFM